MNYVNSIILWSVLAQAGKQGANPANPFTDGMFLPLIAIFVAAYFLLILPERRKAAEQKKQLSLLKKNDRVVTVGGMIGTITNVSPGSDDVTLRIDDNNNTRVRVLRSAISRVVSNSGETSDGDGK